MATSDNAALCAMSGPRNPYPGPLGVVEEGAIADLLLVDGNPLDDLQLLADPDRSLVVIMKDGTIYKQLAGEPRPRKRNSPRKLPMVPAAPTKLVPGPTTGDLMRRSLELGALVAGALMIAACGNSTEDARGTGSATATATTSAPPPPAIVSREQLDVGSYPTAPRPPLGAAGNASSGAVADAQDMADFVVGPWDVDQSLITPVSQQLLRAQRPQRAAAAGTRVDCRGRGAPWVRRRVRVGPPGNRQGRDDQRGVAVSPIRPLPQPRFPT